MASLRHLVKVNREEFGPPETRRHAQGLRGFRSVDVNFREHLLAANDCVDKETSGSLEYLAAQDTVLIWAASGLRGAAGVEQA